MRPDLREIGKNPSKLRGREATLNALFVVCVLRVFLGGLALSLQTPFSLGAKLRTVHMISALATNLPSTVAEQVNTPTLRFMFF